MPDTRYEGKPQEKEAQHKALEGAFKDVDVAIDYEYNVATLPIID